MTQWYIEQSDAHIWAHYYSLAQAEAESDLREADEVYQPVCARAAWLGVPTCQLADAHGSLPA